MHAKKRKGALHEPPFRPRRRARSRHGVGGLSSRTSTKTSRFRVPMRARICVGAAHERPLWPDEGRCILAAMNTSMKPCVAIVFTGGTISMRLDPAAGGAVPMLSGDEILAQVPGLEQ